MGRWGNERKRLFVPGSDPTATELMMFCAPMPSPTSLLTSGEEWGGLHVAGMVTSEMQDWTCVGSKTCGVKHQPGALHYSSPQRM